MKPKYIYKNERQKAFLGAAIGAVTNVVGGIISNKKKKKAEESAFKQQQEAQFRNDNFIQASALSQIANNTGYIDDYKKRISFKCGGRRKAELGTSTDSKTDSSTNTSSDNTKNNSSSTSSSSSSSSSSTSSSNSSNSSSNSGGLNLNLKNIFSSENIGTFKENAVDALPGLGNLATSILTKPSITKMIQRGVQIQVPQEQKVLTNNTYQVDDNGNPIIDTNIDRMQMYRIGGRKRSKCK